MQMFNKYLLLIVLILASFFIVTACNKANKRGTNGRAVKTEYTLEATRVLLLEDCPCVPIQKKKVEEKAIPIVPLAGALLPLAADLAASAFSTYLEKAENDLSAQYLGTGTGQMFENGELKNRCLVIARGKFGPLNADIEAAEKKEAAKKIDKNETDTKVKKGKIDSGVLKKIGLADYPDFYFEAWIFEEAEKDGVLLSIKPQMLHFANTAARRTREGVKFIGIILSLTDDSPPNTDKDKIIQQASSTIQFQFQKVAVGSEYIAEGENQLTVLNPLSDQNKIFKINSAKTKSHLNMYAFITETEDASLFLKLMMNYVKGNEDNLSKALQNVINEGIKLATGGDGT